MAIFGNFRAMFRNSICLSCGQCGLRRSIYVVNFCSIQPEKKSNSLFAVLPCSVVCCDKLTSLHCARTFSTHLILMNKYSQ